ncbi:hypothetical protein [Serratia marcescens]|uniref:hypothetical protein n=1 Tax=Serratia marcescens TaxID=615 RepID=UPI0029D84768|nr:hypothetical protein [Serratia marcescens]MDX7490211.1 hypothetical protein [Serratia marcescens]
MDNKLSELSKPVDISNWKMDSWREAPCNGAEWAKGYFEGWNKYHSKVEEHAPLYSQEYVSALLAELEAKDKKIAHQKICFDNESSSNAWAFNRIRELTERAEAAEKRLAAPVRLPKRYVISLYDDVDWEPHPNGDSYACEEVIVALREQGFTVVEDE